MRKNDLYKAIFGEDYQQESYKYEPHNFQQTKIGKQVCVNCGLVMSNNKFTRWAIDKGCKNSLHPSYQSKRKLSNPMR